jgi:uncharacterized coiled-coil DUF342 family protein
MSGIKSKLREINERTRKIYEQKKTIQNKLKSVNDDRQAREEKIREAKKALGLKRVLDTLDGNLAAIDAEIKEIDARMETSTLGIKTEKELVAKIHQLNRKKEEVRQFYVLKEEISGDSDTATWVAELRALDSDVAAARATEPEHVRELNKLRTKLDAAGKDVPALVKQKNELYAKLDAAYATKEKSRQALAKEKRAAYEARQKQQEAREAARKAEHAEYKAEQERRAAEKAASELAIVPHAEEIETAERLVRYLLPLQASNDDAAADASSSSTNSTQNNKDNKDNNKDNKDKDNGSKPDPVAAAAAEAADGGAVVVINKRSENAARAKKANQKKRGGKKGGAGKKKKSDALQHHLETFAMFAKLGVTPPAKATDVASAIAALNAKKTHFEQLSAEKQAKRKAAAEKKLEELAAAAAAGETAEPSADATPAAAAPAATAADDNDDNELLESFKALDTDNSGTLSRDEVAKVMQNMAEFDTPEKIDAALAKVDVDGDGQINYAEFAALVAQD